MAFSPIIGGPGFSKNSSSSSNSLPTPQRYGAIADGSTHPLSGPYATLAAAQSAYSFTLASCAVVNSSTTVTCADTTPLLAGYPISGANIPANTTVSAITDGTHFVLSAAATGSATETLTSSFVTALTQELDFCAIQQVIYVANSMYLPAGVYMLGNSTLRTCSNVALPGQTSGSDDGAAMGLTITGAGPKLTTLVAGTNTDAIHVLTRYQKFQNFSIDTVAHSGSRGNAVTLGEGAYQWNFHMDHMYIRGFSHGFYNPNGWDEGGISDCKFYNCGTGFYTKDNQDTILMTTTSMVANVPASYVSITSATTNATTTVTCASTTNLIPGMIVMGTDLPESVWVVSVTNSTTFVLNTAATGSHGSLTLTAYTVDMWVDGTGRAEWNGGVSGAPGVTIMTSGSGLANGRNLHIEGGVAANGFYCHNGGNGSLLLERCFFADGGDATLTHIYADAGSQTFVELCRATTGFRVFSNGRTNVIGDELSAVDVNWNTAYHYRAVPWHTAASDESPGANFWDTAAQNVQGQLVSQVGASMRTKLWQSQQVDASTWEWRVINAPAALIVSAANATAQSATNASVVTYTTPNDSTVHSFRAGAYAAITAISAGTLTVQVTFTDENSAAQTISYFPMGLTSAGLTTTGFTPFESCNLRCAANTAITIKTTFTGVSITYDVGGTIESLY